MANYERFTRQAGPDDGEPPMIFPENWEFDDNNDENGPIDGVIKCTMTIPVEGADDEKTEFLGCDCDQPREFMENEILNEGMVFYTLASLE